MPIDSKLNPKASSESKSWSQRVDTLRTYLSRFVSDSRARYVQTQDVGKSEAVAISADGHGQPLLSGPEPIRTELEQFLQSRPDLTNEINELALRSSDSGPLHLLPNTAVATNGSKPWKLWIDA